METVHLTFTLKVEEGWPPIATEGMPCRVVEGGYEILTPPLFVKDIAVGDVIQVAEENEGQVVEWTMVEESRHCTVWVMAHDTELASELKELRELGCNTASLPGWSVYAIDLPPELNADELDARLERYSEEQISVAYPVWRRES